MTFYLHKDVLKKVVMNFKFKYELPSSSNVISNEMPMKEFDLVIDDCATGRMLQYVTCK